jgi:hypothetical protein
MSSGLVLVPWGRQLRGARLCFAVWLGAKPSLGSGVGLSALRPPAGARHPAQSQRHHSIQPRVQCRKGRCALTAEGESTVPKASCGPKFPVRSDSLHQACRRPPREPQQRSLAVPGLEAAAREAAAHGPVTPCDPAITHCPLWPATAPWPHRAIHDAHHHHHHHPRHPRAAAQEAPGRRVRPPAVHSLLAQAKP